MDVVVIINMFGYVVAVDLSSGDVYVTGTVSGTLDGETFAGGSRDIALFKYDTRGNWQWTRLKGSSENDFGYGGTENDVCLDALLVWSIRRFRCAVCCSIMSSFAFHESCRVDHISLSHFNLVVMVKPDPSLALND